MPKCLRLQWYQQIVKFPWDYDQFLSAAFDESLTCAVAVEHLWKIQINADLKYLLPFDEHALMGEHVADNPETYFYRWEC